MGKVNVSHFFKNIQKSVVKHSPEILTGIGIAGMLTSTVLAVKATPKAIKICEEFKRVRIENNEEEPTKMEYVKVAWKHYIPSAITAASSVACLIGANSVHAKRTAALATVYKISENALAEYKEKVVETIGEKKEKAVQDKIAEKKVKENPINTKSIILTEKGDTLFYEPLCRHYFKSDIEKVRKAINDMNEKILSDPFNSGVSLNDFYDSLGIPETDVGDNIGWNLDTGVLKVYMSPQGIEDGSEYDGKLCWVMNYENSPSYNF